MRDVCRAAEKRLKALAKDTADRFGSPILHNSVSAAIHEDRQLRQLVDVTERAYTIEENDRQPDRVQWAAFGAAEDLNDEVERLTTTVVVMDLISIIENADDGWYEDSEIHDKDDVDAAVDEACRWLDEHRDATDVDVDDIIHAGGGGTEVSA